MKSKLKLSLLLIALIMLFVIPKAFADEQVIIEDISQIADYSENLVGAQMVGFAQQDFDHVPVEIETYISKDAVIYGWGNTLLQYFCDKNGYQFVVAEWLGSLDPKNPNDLQYIYNFSDDGTKILGVKAYNMKELVIPEGVEIVQFAPFIINDNNEYVPDPDYLEILSGVEKVTFTAQNPVFIEDYSSLTKLKELWAYEGLGLENYPKFKSLGDEGLYYSDFEYEFLYDDDTETDYILITGIGKEPGNNTLEFPTEIEGYPVKKISNDFDAKAITIRNFKKVIIPDSIDEIGYVYDESHDSEYPFEHIGKSDTDFFFYGDAINFSASIDTTIIGYDTYDVAPKGMYCYSYSNLQYDHTEYTWLYIEDYVEPDDPEDPEEIELLTDAAKEKVVTLSMYGEDVDIIVLTVDDDNTALNFFTTYMNIPEGWNIEFYSSEGSPLGPEDLIGSKSFILISDDTGNVVAQYGVVVKGDITGNGRLALFDAFKILIGCLTGTPLDSTDLLIRDFNGDGSVTLFDAFKFLIKSLQS